MSEDNEFFDSHWVTIVSEIATTGTSVTYDKYESRSLEARRYNLDNIPGKTELIKKFEHGLREPADVFNEYVNSKNKTTYDKFFDHPENMERARKIQSTYVRPDPDPTILSKLRSMITLRPNVHPTEHSGHTKENPDLTIENAINIVEHVTNVKIIPTRYLGSITLHVLSWWYVWNLQRFQLYDGRHLRGNIILHKTNASPTTTSLLTSVPTQIVNAITGYNLVHELTHAVHFSLVPYYKIPRDLVEITPMCMENYARFEFNEPLDDWDVQRQAALAIADMTTDTPDDFNTVFAKNACLENVGDVRARMWHFTNVPFKYYQYAIGMGAHKYSALPNAVRSGDRDVIMKCIE